MKNILFIILGLFIISCSTSKLKSYGEKESDKYATIKTQAEYTSLKIDLYKESENTVTEEYSISGFYGIILDQIVKIPSYIQRGIKNRKKKYTQKYAAHNSLTFETVKYAKRDTNKKNPIFTLPSVKLKRKIFYNKNGETINEVASTIKFIPIHIENDPLFVFKLASIDMKYTKAKTTKKYPFVNLVIEIKATYLEKDANDKLVAKEYKSKNIVLPVRNGVNFNDILNDHNIYSSPFIIEGLRNIEVTVTETNPYFLKLEELQTMVGDNEEDLSNFFGELSKLLKKE
ncbi:MAG: hypothetical protein QM478_04840 [Flavobacteriaceae bacterium]